MAVEDPGLIGRIRNPLTIMQQAQELARLTHSGPNNCWPVEVWQWEQKETLDPKELKTNTIHGAVLKGVHHAGGENVPGVILCDDFKRHYTEWEREYTNNSEMANAC